VVILTLVLALTLPPVPSQRLNDYAGLLPADAARRLEARLAEGERSTGAQVVVAIFPSLEGENLEDVSIRLAERWRVGDRALDRGAILLVFVKERRVRLEVGYGLEPVLPDAVAGRIIGEVIAPRFRAQQYAAGLGAAVEAIYARIDSREAPRPVPVVGVSSWLLGLGVLAIFAVVALLLARESGGGRARRRVYTAGGRRGWGSPTILAPPWWSGGHGGSGGGGFPSGGGGFTPGGGSFGGGGASGRW
jgi:uncharacterized protein